MSKREKVRAAICCLHDAGKTAMDIAATLGCGRSTVYRTINKIKVGEGIKHAVRPKKRPVLTPRVAAGLRRRIRAAPTKSLRQVAAESGRARETVRRVVIESGWRSLRRIKIPLISADGRKRRRDRAAGLYLRGFSLLRIHLYVPYRLDASKTVVVV